LESNLRGAMESRIGYDFSGVHIHADSRADISARAEPAHPTPSAPNERAPNLLAIAHAGLAGVPQSLPHAPEIQRAFGRHLVGDIQAHVGGPAGAAARAIGSRAYAMGDAIGFVQPPDLATA